MLILRNMANNNLDIIRPNDPRYLDVRGVYTATGSPAAVIRPGSAEEVAQALLLARQTGGPLSIRSGGHGVSSISAAKRESCCRSGRSVA